MARRERLRSYYRVYAWGSKIWRRWARQIQFQRALPFLLLFLASEVVSAHLLTEFFVLGEVITMLGCLIVAVIFLYLFTYALLAVQFLVPGFLAVLISMAVGGLNFYFGVKAWFVGLAVYLFPPADREVYRSIAACLEGWLAALGLLVTLGVTAAGLYVQTCLIAGFVERGPEYRCSKFFRSVTKGPEALPRLSDVWRELRDLGAE